jgi:hypothetical protein
VREVMALLRIYEKEAVEALRTKCNTQSRP